MKKTLTIAAAALISASAFAQTVTSANIVGYVKADKPGDGKLNIVGVSFTTETQTLSSLMANENFKGSYTSPAEADQISIWNASNQTYSTYAYFSYLPDYPAYASYDGWQELAKFGTTEYANPVIPAGSGFWLRGSQSGNTNVVMAGEVPTAQSNTIDVVTGLQHLANPFSSDITLGECKFSAKGSYTDPNAADQVSAWDPATQTYKTYVFFSYLPDYPAYASYDGWPEYNKFGSTEYADDVAVPVGYGFWYRAINAFTWSVSNNYYSAINQ
jgi:hypothetical protein